MTVQPFKINVSQATLDDLQARLALTRLPDEVEGANWDYGTNLGYMKSLLDYWRTQFDWRKQEAAINQFAQFTTDIDGVSIHFIHERGKGLNPKPLLLLHGWPDSFYRFYKVIPMLTDPARFGGDASQSFDVVVPSLPGFGFSDKAKTRQPLDAGDLMSRLMTDVLGYKQFGVQGGDTGSPLAQEIAARNPDAVTGVHLTDIGWATTAFLDPTILSPVEQEYAKELEYWSFNEGAYVSIQGTKPQTLAYGLNESPSALAAWITEKFYTWSDNNGDLDNSFTKDELLTNIMIYWVTQTINSSMRWYYDGMHADWDGGGEQQRLQTPVAVAPFPKDHPPPRELAERTLNVQRWTPMPKGGHFAALEEPELLVNDIRAFFSSLS